MRRQRGFSYLLVLFAVAALSLVSLRAMENAHTNDRRAQEEELLYVGNLYRRAIGSYYDNSPGTVKTYPPTLQALLLDNRTTTARRALRRLYRDPITGSADWGLVRTADGTICGVYSRSMLAPLKTAGFAPELAQLTGARHYQDWQFIYQPAASADAHSDTPQDSRHAPSIPSRQS